MVPARCWLRRTDGACRLEPLVDFDPDYGAHDRAPAAGGLDGNSFDDAGAPAGKSASDIGMEIDGNVIVKFDNGLLFKALGGVFLPGDAGALLVNGNTANKDAAWEIKTVGVVKF